MAVLVRAVLGTTRLPWEYLRTEIILMPVLLIILIPLGALVIYAVVFDLKQRRRGGIRGSHDISSAARMAHANADALVFRSKITGGDGGGEGGPVG